MVLESTMICLDNSDYMINTDFAPSRMEAQREAASVFIKSTLGENPKNHVGLLTLTDGEVLTTLINDHKNIFVELNKVEPRGQIRLLSGIRTAHKILKNRTLKHSSMRILAFVGSPLEETGYEMVVEAKNLRKENVAVDIVNFGEVEINQIILTGFICFLNGNEKNHPNKLITVESGSDLSDAVRSMINDSRIDFQSSSSLKNLFDLEKDREMILALQMSSRDFNKDEECSIDEDINMDLFDIASYEFDQVGMGHSSMNPKDGQMVQEKGSMVFLEYSVEDMEVEEEDAAEEKRQDEAGALKEKK